MKPTQFVGIDVGARSLTLVIAGARKQEQSLELPNIATGHASSSGG